jgi:hypothetical protein
LEQRQGDGARRQPRLHRLHRREAEVEDRPKRRVVNAAVHAEGDGDGATGQRRREKGDGGARPRRFPGGFEDGARHADPYAPGPPLVLAV